MSQIYNYDVVIVGAGPAGSSAAWAAARGGASVALLEKEEDVAQTVRTSGVSWIAEIREFGIPDDCFNPVSNFSFCSPGNTVTITDGTPRAAVLDVRKTYRWLASEAKNAGAKLFLGMNVQDVIKDQDGNIAGVTGTHGGKRVEFRSKVVVDASGFGSVVCTKMGLARQWSRFGAGAEYECSAENVKEDTWWLMVGQEYSPAGYAWIFPSGGSSVRIGVGVGKPESDIDPTQRLKEIIEKRLGPIKSLGRITLGEFHYGLIPNDGLSRDTVFENLILVGDTAGHANPLVLEGIRYAIRFGRVAGDVAAKAVGDGDTSAGNLRPYERAWKKEIHSKVRSASRIQSRWIKLSDRQWDEELDIIGQLTPAEFLDFVRADFGISGMLKLAVRHPGTAARQLFGLIG